VRGEFAGHVLEVHRPWEGRVDCSRRTYGRGVIEVRGGPGGNALPVLVETAVNERENPLRTPVQRHGVRPE
jgi:hypothetical protein